MAAGLVDRIARSLAGTLAAVLLLGLAGIGAGIALKLSVVGSFGLYFVVWWTLLFAILPVRVQSQAELGTIVAGTDPGAPAAPALRERAVWTSLVATVVFVALAALFPLAGL